MIPVLFSIGSVKIYTYGVFLVLAFFWGLFFIWKLLRLTSYNEEVVFDGVFLSILGALFFARFFYVLANFSSFGFSFLKFILINAYPGLSLYGALFGGFLTFLLFCLYKRIRLFHIVDYLTTGILVALGFGKLGAFFSGSEIGTRTNFFLSVNYIGYEGKRHLVALYEALIFFLAAWAAYKILLKIRREELPIGTNFYFLFWVVSGAYFLFDPLKKNKLYLFGFNFNRWFSLVLWLTISLGFGYYFRKGVKNFLFGFLAYGKSFITRIYRKTARKASSGKEKNRKGN